MDLSRFSSRVPLPTLDHLYRQFHLPEPPRGFIALIPAESLTDTAPPSQLDLFAYRGAGRDRRRITVEELSPGTEALRALLTAFTPAKVGVRQLMARHVAKPVQALSNKRPHPQLSSGSRLASAVHRIGPIPQAPRVSIIVPIYGRWDFMRYQMESFRTDPELRQAEWIYVVDDPRIADEVVASAEALFTIFGSPFLLVHYGENRGFSGACNLGVRATRADLVLLLNSDVFPVAHGWLQPMIDALAEDVGAVGARLLYEDGAVQHAGMALEPFGPWDNLDIITHPGKGLPDKLLPEQNHTGAGATAACLLMRRADYGAMAGLSEAFVIGDFEDGDLCARLQASGKRVVTTPTARLYHLERQSIRSVGDLQWRETITLYNCWLFNERQRKRAHARSSQHGALGVQA